MLTDDDWHIRFNSEFALAKIGPAGEEAVSALGKLVRDENRYVRYYAALALKRIGDALVSVDDGRVQVLRSRGQLSAVRRKKPRHQR